MMTIDLSSLPAWLQQTPTTGLLITLFCYFLCLSIYKRFNHSALLQPVMISIILIISVLYLIDMPYQIYFEHNAFIHFLLGPATVALAIPLYKNRQRIVELAVPLFSCVIIGSSLAVFIAVALAALFNASEATLLSLTPKSITTPIAIKVAESIKAEPSLTAAFVLITGVVGAVIAEPLFKLLKENDPGVQGIAIGISAHGVGTAKAMEIHPQCGAFSALAMGLTGSYTALVLPYAIEWFYKF